jgi:hypothetical protein
VGFVLLEISFASLARVTREQKLANDNKDC